MNRRTLLKALLALPILPLLRAAKPTRLVPEGTPEIKVEVAPGGEARYEYEWVVGPVKTRPAMRYTINRTDHGTFEQVEVEDSLRCVVYGQLRRWDGQIVSWAKAHRPEEADPEVARWTARWPKAKDHRDHFFTQESDQAELIPGEGEFEDGIICKRGEGYVGTKDRLA